MQSLSVIKFDCIPDPDGGSELLLWQDIIVPLDPQENLDETEDEETETENENQNDDQT